MLSSTARCSWARGCTWPGRWARSTLGTRGTARKGSGRTPRSEGWPRRRSPPASLRAKVEDGKNKKTFPFLLFLGVFFFDLVFVAAAAAAAAASVAAAAAASAALAAAAAAVAATAAVKLQKRAPFAPYLPPFEPHRSLAHAAVRHRDPNPRHPALARGLALYPLQNLQPLDDPPDDDMFAVAPRGFGQGKIKLAPVAVLAAIGHAHDAGGGVPQLEARGFVLELAAKDGLRAGAVAADEVPSLADEPRDDAMEGGSLVAEGSLARFADSLLAGAERAEVLAGPGGGGVKELDDEPPGDEGRGLFGSGGALGRRPARIGAVALEEQGGRLFVERGERRGEAELFFLEREEEEMRPGSRVFLLLAPIFALPPPLFSFDRTSFFLPLRRSLQGRPRRGYTPPEPRSTHRDPLSQSTGRRERDQACRVFLCWREKNEKMRSGKNRSFNPKI